MQRLLAYSLSLALCFFAGTQSVPCIKGHHQASSCYSWALGEKASCCNSEVYLGNCKISGACSWKESQAG